MLYDDVNKMRMTEFIANQTHQCIWYEIGDWAIYLRFSLVVEVFCSFNRLPGCSTFDCPLNRLLFWNCSFFIVAHSISWLSLRVSQFKFTTTALIYDRANWQLTWQHNVIDTLYANRWIKKRYTQFAMPGNPSLGRCSASLANHPRLRRVKGVEGGRECKGIQMWGLQRIFSSDPSASYFA